PIQFRSGNLAQFTRNVLQETGLDPERLELEVTEGTLIDDLSGVTTLLRQIKSLGVRIAMDDFGTGYSSLSYLQAFPFGKIKIDRSFIANLDRNPHSAAIVRAVIGLGRGLGVTVLAEGVETEAQRLFLWREQCDAIQGHLIGMAAPASQYVRFTGAGEVVRQESAQMAHAGLLRGAGITAVAPGGAR
ncbi:MAG: EAL domain-containing protein, partial [Pseudorhodoplanes sp.]|nr:EAL domain-containing protein [Pseudorhodoplanes sp.]